MVLGAGDIALVRVVGHGEVALVAAHDKDGVPLQAFGRVDGAYGHTSGVLAGASLLLSASRASTSGEKVESSGAGACMRVPQH